MNDPQGFVNLRLKAYEENDQPHLKDQVCLALILLGKNEITMDAFWEIYSKAEIEFVSKSNFLKKKKRSTRKVVDALRQQNQVPLNLFPTTKMEQSAFLDQYVRPFCLNEFLRCVAIACQFVFDMMPNPNEKSVIMDELETLEYKRKKAPVKVDHVANLTTERYNLIAEHMINDIKIQPPKRRKTIPKKEMKKETKRIITPYILLEAFRVSRIGLIPLEDQIPLTRNTWRYMEMLQGIAK